jgi:hypothetical protein
MYQKCPKQWDLAYIQGLRTFSQSIHTLFGTAFHETLQTYLTIMLEETGEHFSTKFELMEFYNDGVAILDWIKKNRVRYFSAKNDELVGIEVEIYHPVLPENEKVLMLGYLDVVLRDKRTDRVRIRDIKTSTMGWNKYQKADKIKASQLVLYKEYFAKQYGFDVDKIDILYFIVKRKLIEGAMFPQRRVQEFIPASGKPTRNKLVRSIEEWIGTCFDKDGNYNTNRQYPAIAGKNNKNCKYCEFADKDDLCSKANRIKA